jgi:glycosyltransferase involved in cell wall biosynthesis
MRILIHDFAGHPFQVQLSRELAFRGHAVTHAYPVGLQGPKGQLHLAKEDPPSLSITGIPLSGTFRKYSAVRRFVAHRKYANDLKALIRGGQFDVVLSGNTPIDVQAELLWHCHRRSVGFVHWVQDVYSHAMQFFLRKKLPLLALPLSYPFRKIEQFVARSSDASIVIAQAFCDVLSEWGVPTEKISVIENWAPLDEIKLTPRWNAWSKEQGLCDAPVFLYSGTLGLKHRPDLLYQLAQSLGSQCKVVVISEGTGREWLEAQPPLPNLVLLNFQPYGRLSEALASADVLLATLEADAGVFAVPSKILTYLCASRPLLFAAPPANLSSEVVKKSGGGITVDPDQPSEWISAAKLLAESPELRATLAASGRKYAERTFEIGRIGDAFEEILLKSNTASLPSSSKTKAAASSN